MGAHAGDAAMRFVVCLDAMSFLTYIESQDGSQGQAAGMAPRGSENATVVEGGAALGRIFVAAVTACGEADHAAFEADARDWAAMSRVTSCGRRLDMAHRVPGGP